MILKAVSSWLFRSPTARFGVLLLGAAVLCASGGCSKKKKTLASIKNEYSKRDYEETMVLCEHALRNNVVNGEVYYYYGMSLLEVGRDFESLNRFEEAVRLDSSLANPIADFLEGKARESLKGGNVETASERLKTAAEFVSDADFGVLRYLVADAYFKEKEFPKAAQFYEAALGEHPDTAAAENAYFNLVDCYLALGDSTGAVRTLERQLVDFPTGGLSTRAKWKLVRLLYEEARAEFERGNYETVLEIVGGLLQRTDNISLVQRARFLLGETYERMGDYAKAYEQYKTIIKEDRGASGRIVERAKAKIEAFRDAGLL